MNRSHLRALFKLVWPNLVFLLIFPLGSLWIAIKQWGVESASSLQFGPLDNAMAVPIIVGAILLFPGPLVPAVGNAFRSYGVEFLFSLPISRSLVFWVKSGIYLLGCLLFPAILWGYSYTQPVVDLRVPYPAQHRVEMKQFYLSRFSDARLSREQDVEMIVLPKGAIDRSALRFFTTAAILLLMQTAAVFLMQKQWGGVIAGVGVFLLLCGGPFLFLTQNTPTLYESGVAAVANHFMPIVAFGAIFTAVVQFVCLRRFCRTEIR